MARPLRLEFADALYHITSRGDRREAIYENDMDRLDFLSLLADVCDRLNWLCHAYCLMGNHYHLLIQTPDGNLCRGMRQLNGIYAQRFNRHHDRVGHVFQGRYKAILVDKEAYLLELARYIVLNPVRAHMVRSAGEWRWSSYRAMIGQTKPPTWLQTTWLLTAFGQHRSAAIVAYRRYVAAGKAQPSIWENLRNQILLGDEHFANQMQHRVDVNATTVLSEVPKRQRRPEPKSLATYKQQAASRNEAIRAAYASGGYTLKALGDFFGLHYSQISRIARKAKVKT